MPQMSPIYWSYLFLTFILLMLIVFIKIYFTFNPNFTEIKKSLSGKESIKIKWMW
nr:ATP synthase F0 subunit 8 [Aphaenomurus interpositus]